MQPLENCIPVNKSKVDAKRLLHRALAGGPIIGLVLVFLFFMWRSPAAFHSTDNIKLIVLHTVIVGVSALGMVFVMISGAIDLSIGSVVALSMVATARLIFDYRIDGMTAPSALIVFAAALLGILVGALCGAFIGLVTTKLKLAPFIVTLGMMEIARGLAKWLAEETTIYPPRNNWLTTLMQMERNVSWYQLPVGVWLMIALLVVVHIALHKTVFGRYVFAIGSSEATARLCGINVDRFRIIIHTLAGMFIGLSGVLYYSMLRSGEPTEGQGLELKVIAAVVIGGASMSGGSGSAFGAIIGALIMTTMGNDCTMLGVPSFVQNLIVGVVIIAAVAVDRLKHKLNEA